MAGEEEAIDIIATMRDEVSRPARTAAQSVDELGDEAQQTAVQLEELSAAEDDAADSADKLARKSAAAARRLEAQQRASSRLRDEQGRFVKSNDQVTESVKAQENWFKRLWSSMGGGNSGKRSVGMLGKFFNFFKGNFGKVSFWVLLGTGVSFLGTAIEGLGAAGIAATAGLAPLTGMLIAYPGILGTVLQGFAALKLATHGVGDLIGVMMDPEATAEEIEKALEGMSQNAVTFSRAVADSADGWKKVRQNIGARFFKDMDDTYRDLSKTYMPIVDKYLGRTAQRMGFIVRMTEGWLDSEQGQKQITNIMRSNAYETEQYGGALFNVFRIVTGLVNAANPMLRELSTDTRNITNDIKRATDDNQGRLRRFFSGSYDLFEDVSRVTGSYLRGLYNIGKQADSLANFMGGSLDTLGQRFEAWTESKSGKKDIRQWFNDMIPVVQELGYWIRDLAKAGAEITMGDDDFLTASRALREEVLPAFVDIFKATSGQVVPAAEELAETVESLKEAGVGGGIRKSLGWFVDGIQATADLVAQLPPDVKNLLGWAAGVFAAYKIINRVTGGAGSGLASLLTGGRIGSAVGATPANPMFVKEVGDLPGGKRGTPGGPGTAGKILKVGGAAALSFGAVAYGAEKMGQYLGERPVVTGVSPADNEEYRKNLPHLLEELPKTPVTTTIDPRTMLPTLNFNPLYEGYDELTEKMDGTKTAGIEAGLQMLIYGKRVQDTGGKIDETTGKTKAMKDWLDQVNHDYNTRLNTPGFDEGLDKVRNLKYYLDGLPLNKTVNLTVNRAVQNANSAFNQVADFLDGTRYTGGETLAGKNYLVGEHGMEAWINRSGQMKMLGVNGPEIAAPGAGAVIPAGATRAPESASYGLAPDWAKAAYQKAAKPSSAPSGAHGPVNIDVSVGPFIGNANPGDVLSEVNEAMEKAKRDWEERQ